MHQKLRETNLNGINIAENSKITALQRATIFICFLVNMLDGMDVMVISYASPAISKQWAVSPEALGGVFSAGLVGMALGALLIAPYADIFGRRAIILLSALLMGLMVFATCWAQSVEQLLFFRFLSGLGIGSLLASSATLTSEYAPAKTKDFWISFVMGGYPVGAVFSGLVAAQIIPVYGWRVMFQVAGFVTLSLIPLIFFFLAESLDFLLKKQPQGALQNANIILKKMKKETLIILPPQSAEALKKLSVIALLTPERKTSTLQLWLSIFLALATLYFLTTWIPKLASATGLSLSLAIYAGTVFNLGAFFGILTQGYLSGKFGLRKTIFSFFLFTALLMLLFGFISNSILILIIFGFLGFGVQGGFVGLYSVATRLYPTEIRSTGVGFAMSSGRIGGIAGPILGGILIGAGLSVATNFIVFAIPVICAGIVALLIQSKKIE